MNELRSFRPFASVLGLAGLDYVRILILESPLIQLSVVDIEAVRHLCHGAHVASFDVPL